MPGVIIGIPIMRGQLEPESFHSLMLARNELYKRGIANNVLTNECSFISASRNTIAEGVIKNTDADYLMWIDSDTQYPPYAIPRLIARGKDIIGGVYYHKDQLALPTVYLYGNDERFTHYLDFGMDKPFVCDGIGTGFLLIKREVLLRFTPEVCKEFGPPFAVGHAPDGTEEGEDLSFCRRAKKLGYEIWADPTIPLGHVGKKSYTREDYDQAMEFQAWSRKGNTYEEHNIEGWMSIGELNWLHKTAGEMDSIVEIGSWKGRSTHALLSGCKGKVIAVDTWKGTPGEAGQPFIDAESRDVFTEDFMKNVGEFKNLEPMRMTSLEAAALIPDKSVDMVFIDGAHNYESVRDDIEAWLPKARKLICGHDYQWHGVQEAVTERFGGAFDTAETIWVKRLE